MDGGSAAWEDTVVELTKTQTIISWTLQLVAAAILLQTLFFKFTGAEESVYIFTTLGLEPWGRIGSGVVELIACILLLVPRTVPLGAIQGLCHFAAACDNGGAIRLRRIETQG